MCTLEICLVKWDHFALRQEQFLKSILPLYAIWGGGGFSLGTPCISFNASPLFLFYKDGQ